MPTQVSGRLPSPSAQATARKLGAQLALDAIDFDEALRPAMAYVFGHTFICKVGRTVSQSWLVRTMTPSGSVTPGCRTQRRTFKWVGTLRLRSSLRREFGSSESGGSATEMVLRRRTRRRRCGWRSTGACRRGA